MAQATSGEITYTDWLRHVTCRSIFRIEPVRITGFISHFGTTKENSEEHQKFNEFSKLITKPRTGRTMNSLKECYTKKKNN